MKMEKLKSVQGNTGTAAWLNTLQGARFPFALLVWLSHLEVPPFGARFDFGGECAVSFFFVLSGFLLSHAYGRRVTEGKFATRTFVFRHLCKLYPLHLLLFAAVLALDTVSGRGWRPAQLAANLLLVQTWIPSGSFTFVVNGVSWYLCDIFFFYLVFGWLYRVLSRVSPRAVAGVGAVWVSLYLFAAGRVPDDLVNALLYVNPLLRLPDFACGILVFRLWKSARAAKALCHIPSPLLGILPIVTVALAFAVYGLAPHWLGCQLLLLPASALCVLSLALAESRRSAAVDVWRGKALSRLGGLSFEFFMCHTLVFRLVRCVLAPDGGCLSALSYAAVSLALSVALAWLLSRFFVRPLYRHAVSG